jgi:hypothetical protein
MKQVHYNSSIECLSADVISRKIMPSSYMDVKLIGKCRTYKCSRNSEAKILKELAPKKAYCNLNSALDLDDRIEAEDLFLAINSSKSVKISLVNHSGRHKAQTFISEFYTFAKISKQFPNIAELRPQKTLLEPAEVKVISK